METAPGRFPVSLLWNVFRGLVDQRFVLWIAPQEGKSGILKEGLRIAQLQRPPQVVQIGGMYKLVTLGEGGLPRRSSRRGTGVEEDVRLFLRLGASLLRLRPLGYAVTSGATPSQDAMTGFVLAQWSRRGMSAYERIRRLKPTDEQLRCFASDYTLFLSKDTS